MPTFSPSVCQFEGAWLARLGLWEMVPAAAMWLDQPLAMPLRAGSTDSGPRPLLARSWLSSETNCEESAAGSAPTVGAARPRETVVRATTVKSLTMSRMGLGPPWWSAEGEAPLFGSPAAVEPCAP